MLLWLTLLWVGCDTVSIVDKPITWNQEREKLSLDYMKVRHGIEASEAKIDPKIIVVHWTVIPTMEKSFEVFDRVKLPSSRTGIKNASSLNVSAHFLVDRDGTIYQLLPETTFARHVIGLNYCSIGIENVADGDSLPLTESQFEANKKLIDHLFKKHDIEYLIGHDQYKQFIGHPLWKETDPNYLTEKSDVGSEFISRLHESIKKELKKAPAL
ncbi:MAG: peptidoglycan recognition family protein [Bacteroidota bacterium]